MAATTNFTKHNLVFSTICLGGLLLLLMISVRPIFRQNAALNKQIADLKAEARRQEQMQTYVSLVENELKKLKAGNGLPNVQITPLPHRQSAEIAGTVREIARRTHMELTSLAPIISTRKKEWRNLEVKAELRGKFTDLRSFVFELLSLPYIQHIDQLKINSAPARLNITVTFTVVLA